MKDELLLVLISLAEVEEPIETDVTLLVGGFLVSGFIVSAKKYMEHHVVTKRISRLREQIRSTTPAAEDGEDTPLNFIHLRDAKFYTPGGPPIPQNKSIFWRGCLESVHGFSLGVLAAEVRYLISPEPQP
jgi:hypothetical protein